MKAKLTALMIATSFSSLSVTAEPVVSRIVPFGVEDAEQLVLKNDSFAEGGGQAYLQMGFVQGEMAGVWLPVPAGIEYFKVDSFRVLYGSSMDGLNGASEDSNQIFFQMGIASAPSPAVPRDIENAAQVTPGPYWNDVPATGEGRQLRCARAGEYVGAALEFTHTGTPSVYRDLDGISKVQNNTLFAIPGGWNYSVAFGLRGDWILRVVGHAATKEECGL
jgi:hypothetical protein